MDHAKGLIAILDIVDEHTETVNIRELLKADRLALHLAEDRIGPLFAPADIGHKPLLGEGLFQFTLNLLDQGFVVAAKTLQALGNRLERIRVHILEGQPFQLLPDVLHAHALGQRGIDVDGFLRDALALVFGHKMQGAHIMQNGRRA